MTYRGSRTASRLATSNLLASSTVERSEDPSETQQAICGRQRQKEENHWRNRMAHRQKVKTKDVQLVVHMGGALVEHSNETEPLEQLAAPLVS